MIALDYGVRLEPITTGFSYPVRSDRRDEFAVSTYRADSDTAC